jgi:hypothetical protein
MLTLAGSTPALLLATPAAAQTQGQLPPEEHETGMYGGGASGAVETTGLAVQALLKWGQSSATAAKALAYIASKKTAGRHFGHYTGDHHGPARAAAGH